jgi:hypothetical protein
VLQTPRNYELAYLKVANHSCQGVYQGPRYCGTSDMFYAGNLSLYPCFCIAFKNGHNKQLLVMYTEFNNKGCVGAIIYIIVVSVNGIIRFHLLILRKIGQH